MVEHFLDDLFETHNAQPRTVKDIKVLMGYIMEQAIKDGIIAYNPVKEVYPLTDEQLEMFRQIKRKENANRKLCGNGYFDSD